MVSVRGFSAYTSSPACMACRHISVRMCGRRHEDRVQFLLIQHVPVVLVRGAVARHDGVFGAADRLQAFADLPQIAVGQGNQLQIGRAFRDQVAARKPRRSGRRECDRWDLAGPGLRAPWPGSRRGEPTPWHRADSALCRRIRRLPAVTASVNLSRGAVCCVAAWSARWLLSMSRLPTLVNHVPARESCTPAGFPIRPN